MDEKEDHDDFLDSVFLSPVKKKRSDGISTSPYEEQYNQKDVKKEMADFAMYVFVLELILFIFSLIIIINLKTENKVKKTTH